VSLRWKFPFPARGGDRFDDWVVDHQFEPYYLRHPALANRTVPATRLTGRFCGHFRPVNSLILVSVGVRAFQRRFLAPRLCIQKFRSWRPGLEANSGPHSQQLRFSGQHNSRFWAGVAAFRIKSECLELLAPFGRQIPETLDADAAGQAAFYGGSDEIGSEEGERNRQIDLPNAALLAGAQFGDGGYSTRDHILQPPTTSGDGADQARTALKLFRSNFASRCVTRE
jgi:hypothetical protein